MSVESPQVQTDVKREDWAGDGVVVVVKEGRCCGFVEVHLRFMPVLTLERSKLALEPAAA